MFFTLFNDREEDKEGNNDDDEDFDQNDGQGR